MKILVLGASGGVGRDLARVADERTPIITG
jgi:uncharacterized protein YbjT (DUF2867 family)